MQNCFSTSKLLLQIISQNWYFPAKEFDFSAPSETCICSASSLLQRLPRENLLQCFCCRICNAPLHFFLYWYTCLEWASQFACLDTCSSGISPVRLLLTQQSLVWVCLTLLWWGHGQKSHWAPTYMSHTVFTSLFSPSSKCRDLGGLSLPPPCFFVCNKVHSPSFPTQPWRISLGFFSSESDDPTPRYPCPWFFQLWSSPDDSSSPNPWEQQYSRAILSHRPHSPLLRGPLQPLANEGAGPGCLHAAAGSLWSCHWELEDCIGQTGIDRGRSLFYLLHSWYKKDNYPRGSLGLG